MMILALISLALAAFSLGVLVGIYCFDRKPHETTEQAASQIIHRNKPGGIFKEEVPSGPVQRPDAETIAKWNEDPNTKAQKDALKETFDADPALVKLKEEYAKTAKY